MNIFCASLAAFGIEFGRASWKSTAIGHWSAAARANSSLSAQKRLRATGVGGFDDELDVGLHDRELDDDDDDDTLGLVDFKAMTELFTFYIIPTNLTTPIVVFSEVQGMRGARTSGSPSCPR